MTEPSEHTGLGRVPGTRPESLDDPSGQPIPIPPSKYAESPPISPIETLREPSDIVSLPPPRDHPERPEGNQRSAPRTPALPAAVSELAQIHSEWVRRDRSRLFNDAFLRRGPAADQFLSTSLRYAKRSLDAAHNALTEQAALFLKSDAQAAAKRETIRALAHEADWLELLECTALEPDEAVRQAVRALARSVDKLRDRDELAAATLDFASLLENIEFLQSEVVRAIAADRTVLPNRYLRDLLRTAWRVSAATLLAIIAALPDPNRTGFVRDIVFAGLGAVVANSVALLFAAVSQETRSVTPAGQMRQLHQQLIIALQSLREIIIPWLESAPALPEVRDNLEKVRVGTVFLVSNLDQLAIRLLGEDSVSYRRLLDAVRVALVKVQVLLAGQGDESATAVCARLLGAGAGLQDQSGRIDSL